MKRLWEIDFLRGIAILQMISFNWSFVLRHFDLFLLTTSWFYWFWVPRIGGALFLFIVGLALVLSYSRVKKKSRKFIYKKYIIRGLKIFSLGLLITFVTWLFFPDGFIMFGILHVIGLSVILAIPFLKFKKMNLALGLLIIGLGVLLYNYSFDFSWLLWLGFIPKNFYTFDYFPIIPWFGMVLLGIFFGNTFYTNGKRKFRIKDYSKARIIKEIIFAGKNTLWIYLLHQPFLVILLILLGFIQFPLFS